MGVIVALIRNEDVLYDVFNSLMFKSVMLNNSINLKSLIKPSELVAELKREFMQNIINISVNFTLQHNKKTLTKHKTD